MPWGDCTGPWWAHNRGYGHGHDRGYGMGRGWRAFGSPQYGTPWWASPEKEKEFLNSRIKFLEEELEYLRDRMKKLDTQE